MGLAQIDDPLVMRITFEAAMMWPNVGNLHCKSWYLWERNRFIGKLPRIRSNSQSNVKFTAGIFFVSKCFAAAKIGDRIPSHQFLSFSGEGHFLATNSTRRCRKMLELFHCELASLASLLTFPAPAAGLALWNCGKSSSKASYMSRVGAGRWSSCTSGDEQTCNFQN